MCCNMQLRNDAYIRILKKYCLYDLICVIANVCRKSHYLCEIIILVHIIRKFD